MQSFIGQVSPAAHHYFKSFMDACQPLRPSREAATWARRYAQGYVLECGKIERGLCSLSIEDLLVRSTAAYLRTCNLLNLQKAELHNVLLVDLLKALSRKPILQWNDPANRHIIADHARHMRVPAVFPRREFCEVGGLISYGPSIPHLIWHLAMFVERIADGMRAGDIPVEWPTVIETVVNKRTADAIGITLPVVVLARADEVIE